MKYANIAEPIIPYLSIPTTIAIPTKLHIQ